METNITIPLAKYEEMTNRIARYNALVNSIRDEIDAGNQYPVNDSLVLTLTGLKAYQARKAGKHEG